ncbi:MAG: 2-oxoacid:acceptor oxidoreductase family protein [Deltaproteobacteria bacterium]|nr:2-oxoacid:acceptor oxidoreductase family protein [Deltaproteobacteria bacterium]MBW2340801.1 2-oxoacid:acceptor oxidoreductase family protein [Deltaproteobacteria bacterium]
MGELKQIRFCGFGGQGVVLAGTILGYAAIKDGKWVSGSNSYGAQARGGSARSEVVISDDPIKFPHVIESDILVALSQSAYDIYIKNVARKGALAIYDDLLVKPSHLRGVQQIGVPATNTAIHQLESKQATNMVMLGASVAITRIVNRQALISSTIENVAERFRGVNVKALEVGFKLGEHI